MESYLPNSLEVKVIVVGSAGVGKTSIVIRHKENRFDPSVFHTLGASYHRFVIPVSDRRIIMHIWDTAGEEKFKSMMPMYYRDAVAALLVYDVTDELSFRSLNFWVTDMRLNLGDEILICVIGNKADQNERREVTTQDAEAYTTKVGALFYLETSALTGQGVNEVFGKLAVCLQSRSTQLRQSGRIDDSFGEPVSLTDPPIERIDAKRACNRC